ncbi:MAG TPA: ABC transporter permease [Chloroflexota bacterium]|nr:ABC transporter permease [Chloroflexota bacterium]
MKIVADSWYMAVRDLRNLSRQPWYIAFTLVQPIIYLVFFAQLFKRVVEIPGFGSGSYIAFLTPGVVVMTALFSGGWSGMSAVQDLDRGVMDRFLVSPVSRLAIIVGRMVQLAVVTLVQATIIVVLGVVQGASFPSGLAGVAVVIAAAILLALPFAALSNGLGLAVRQEESVIGANNFILLPLTFLSAVFMAQRLMPGWMQQVANFNPVNWAVSASRTATETDPNWSFVLARLGWLALLCVACTWLATLAFRSYQRSI